MSDHLPSESSVNNEHLILDHAFIFIAKPDPTHAILYLSVPGSFRVEVYFLDKLEVEAHALLELEAHLIFDFKLKLES